MKDLRATSILLRLVTFCILFTRTANTKYLHLFPLVFNASLSFSSCICKYLRQYIQFNVNIKWNVFKCCIYAHRFARAPTKIITAQVAIIHSGPKTTKTNVFFSLASSLSLFVVLSLQMRKSVSICVVFRKLSHNRRWLKRFVVNLVCYLLGNIIGV